MLLPPNHTGEPCHTRWNFGINDPNLGGWREAFIAKGIGRAMRRLDLTRRKLFHQAV